MLFPTSSTPAAPSSFKRSLFTFFCSLTCTRKRVIQASKEAMFSLPPSATNTSRGSSPASAFPAPSFAFATSRPGVLNPIYGLQIGIRSSK